MKETLKELYALFITIGQIPLAYIRLTIKLIVDYIDEKFEQIWKF